MTNPDHERAMELFGDDLPDDLLEHIDDPEILKKWPQGLADMLTVIEAALVRDGQPTETARQQAFLAVRALASYAGGRSLYVPKGEQLDIALRDRQIWEQHNGHNVDALARRYHLTEVQIYSILARQRKLARRRVQPDLL